MSNDADELKKAAQEASRKLSEAARKPCVNHYPSSRSMPRLSPGK